METPVTLVETMFEKVEAYAKTTIELTRLRAVETSAKVVTSFVSRVSVIVMFSLFALVLTVGVAFFLGDLLGKMYYGFFIVAAFYLLAGILLHFYMHKWIKKPLSETVSKRFEKVKEDAMQMAEKGKSKTNEYAEEIRTS